MSSYAAMAASSKFRWRPEMDPRCNAAISCQPAAASVFAASPTAWAIEMPGKRTRRRPNGRWCWIWWVSSPRDGSALPRRPDKLQIPSWTLATDMDHNVLPRGPSSVWRITSPQVFVCTT